MRAIEPEIRFTGLAMKDIEAALAAPVDAGNVIALEVYRLVDGYAMEHAHAIQQFGYVPVHLFQIKPQTNIETIALCLAIEALRKKLVLR